MIAERYARALFHMSKEWLITLEDLKRLFNPELMSFFSSPLIPWREKETILKKKLPFLEPEILNFLRLLVKKKRFQYFPDIVQAYKEKAYDQLGIVEGTLLTPVLLDEKMKKNLSDKWGILLDKKIIMQEKLDKRLIGGGVLMFKDKRIDFSLKGKLKQLQNAMRGA